MLRLLLGETINQSDWKNDNHVTIRSVQRDISDINDAISSSSFPATIKVTHSNDHIAYHLSKSTQLDPQIIITLIKTILSTRAFNKDELNTIIENLLAQVNSDTHQIISQTIKNELSLYIPISHQRPLLDLIWSFSQWIKEKTTIQFSYKNSKDEVRNLSGLPTGLIFDTYYFYAIIHFHATKHHPARDAQYRLDRFQSSNPIQEHINFPYHGRLEEGKIRQTNNLMQIGNIISVEFEYYGNPEVVLDKFPMSKIKSAGLPNIFKINEVNRTGFKIWALSQGSTIKIIFPQNLIDEIIDETSSILELYK